MAEKGAQEKTEKPTARRRRKAREQGQVAKSMEISSVGVLLAGITSLWLFGGFFYDQIAGLMRHMFQSISSSHLDYASLVDLSSMVWSQFLITVLPVWAAVSLVAIVMNLAQVGFLFAPKRIKPDLKKINPINGFKKFFSMRLLVDLMKNVGKLSVVGGVAFLTVRQEWENLPNLGSLPVSAIAIYILQVCFTIFWRTVLAMVILAILDWSYQKWDFEKNLKMSKQEIKDEFKQTEGDPQVKGRIRSIQREQAKKRMMNDVPQADVVITNPTHLAVALSYKVGQMDAPTVVAKGANKVAEKIKAIAKEHNIPIIEDKPLAQALYKAVEVGQSIPGDLYEAVATILAHVYRMKNKHREVLAGTRAARQPAK
jgi:flagellar biosynthetic protein FlhB